MIVLKFNLHLERLSIFVDMVEDDLYLLQNLFPMLSVQQLVQRLYPHKVMLGKEGRTAVEGVLSVSFSNDRELTLTQNNNWVM